MCIDVLDTSIVSVPRKKLFKRIFLEHWQRFFLIDCFKDYIQVVIELLK